MQEKPSALKINYIKTNNYRTYYIDGAHGGLTPKLKLYMDLFIDRNITPRIIEHNINEDGTLQTEGRIIETKEGTAREIECGIVMDMDTAKSIYDWLGTKIEEYNQIVQKLQGAKH